MTDADRGTEAGAPAGEVDQGTSGDGRRSLPTLAPSQWVTFALVLLTTLMGALGLE